MVTQKIITYLKEEVEPLSTRERIVFIFLTGFFIFLFLLFFQPFGVNNYDPNETITFQFFWIMALMGLVVSLIIGFNEFTLYRVFMKPIPSRIAMFFWMIWSIIWLSSCVFVFYNYLGSWHDFVFESWIEFIGNIGVLSLIPIIGILVYIKIRDLSTVLNARELSLYASDAGEKLIHIRAENEKDQFTIPLKYLLYVESQDNYIAVHYFKEEELRKVLVRKSLKSLQEEDHHPALLRCHRSFMVNMKHIREVRGNKKRLLITLESLSHPIPVSRQYVDAVHGLVTQ